MEVSEAGGDGAEDEVLEVGGAAGGGGGGGPLEGCWGGLNYLPGVSRYFQNDGNNYRIYLDSLKTE